MKTCEQYKEIILTDYMDGQLSADLKKEIDVHLLSCAGCRELYQEIKTQIIVPFEKASRAPVPDHLWDSIQEKLTAESASVDPVHTLLNYFKGFVFSPRFAPVLLTLVIMIFVSSSVLRQIEIKKAKNKEQSGYLVSLMDTSSPTEEPGGNLGTAIEQYFL